MILNRFCTTWISVIVLAAAYVSTEDDHHKRAPSGFTGVRGKKSIPDGAYSSDEPEHENLIQQNYDSYGPNTQPPSSINYLEKRAPSGFFGMRGKKPWSYPEEFKRAPMGFVGMRGKKATSDDFDYVLDDYPKRAQMGFFGMRGKKYFVQPGYSSEDILTRLAPSRGYFEDKRAPAGFFGMRGKKRPSGFFGMRGKKYPYEFRGKFVGVRGKKSLNDVTLPDNYLTDLSAGRFGEDLDWNQLMLLLTEQNEAADSSQ
ncbi:tachykinins isoform X2 [Sitophilus oryzae]|uniref:Tachykinins isoform X2 n=1 Tax=Sitophilus oryzae TaxID=7048 RepID=A0A6J2Y6J4_SITOR|nr:tachykinins isoform X2 [Sitophilus oryzae]